MQVLRAHLVIRPVKPALHHRPERFHTVCVGLLTNVLTYTVFYPKMITRYTYLSSCFGYRPQEYAAWEEAVAQFKDEVAEIGRGALPMSGSDDSRFLSLLQESVHIPHDLAAGLNGRSRQAFTTFHFLKRRQHLFHCGQQLLVGL